MLISIVKTENNRISKFAEFGTQEEADSHVSIYGGFVHDNSNNTNLRDLWIDGNMVTIVDVVDPSPSEAEIQMKGFIKGWAKREALKENKTPRQIMDEIRKQIE